MSTPTTKSPAKGKAPRTSGRNRVATVELPSGLAVAIRPDTLKDQFPVMALAPAKDCQGLRNRTGEAGTFCGRHAVKYPDQSWCGQRDCQPPSKAAKCANHKDGCRNPAEPNRGVCVLCASNPANANQKRHGGMATTRKAETRRLEQVAATHGRVSGLKLVVAEALAEDRKPATLALGVAGSAVAYITTVAGEDLLSAQGLSAVAACLGFITVCSLFWLGLTLAEGTSWGSKAAWRSRGGRLLRYKGANLAARAGVRMRLRTRGEPAAVPAVPAGPPTRLVGHSILEHKTAELYPNPDKSPRCGYCRRPASITFTSGIWRPSPTAHACLHHAERIRPAQPGKKRPVEEKELTLDWSETSTADPAEVARKQRLLSSFGK